jgi:hypothetical protein
MSFGKKNVFRPSTNEDLQRYEERARSRELAKQDVKNKPKLSGKELKQEISRHIERQKKEFFRMATRAEHLKPLYNLLFDEDKIEVPFPKRFLRLYFRMLQLMQDRDEKIVNGMNERKPMRKVNAKPPVWPLVLPDHEKSDEGFIADVRGLWCQFTWEQERKLINAAMGEKLKICKGHWTAVAVNGIMDRVLGVLYDSRGSEVLRDRNGTLKLWSRFRSKYMAKSKIKESNKKLGKKSKKVSKAVEAEEVEDEEETEAPKTKKSKKEPKKKDKWADKAASIEEDEDEEEESPKKKKKLKEPKSKKEKTEAPERRKRSSNLTDETRLKRVGDKEYRGALGELYELIPRSGISVGKLTSLAKKKKHPELRVRQYLSIFRRDDSVLVKE